MPETASERALLRLRLKNCNETRNCTIELKEVGEGNRTRVIYEAKARKTFKLFGLFKNREDLLRLISGGYINDEDINKRPLSKLIKDISEELGLI